jgi:hypothetical protein
MGKKWYEEIFDDEFINRTMLKEKDFKKLDSKINSQQPLPSTPLGRLLYPYHKEIKISLIVIGIILTISLVFLITILP